MKKHLVIVLRRSTIRTLMKDVWKISRYSMNEKRIIKNIERIHGNYKYNQLSNRWIGTDELIYKDSTTRDKYR